MISAEQVLQAVESYLYKTVIAGHDEKTALACVKALFNCLWLNFRRGLMYIPTVDKSYLEQRDQAIWDEFNGSNQAELGIKYMLSTMQIYSITKRMRKAAARKVQVDLFPLPPEAANKKPVTLFVVEDYLPPELVLCGLPETEAKAVAGQVALFLCQTFPGVSVCISDALRKKRDNDGQQGLFD